VLKTKDFKFELKAGDEGKFSGKASVYGVVDFGGDVVMPGAFAKSLAANGGQVPVLNHHNTHDPIGLAQLSDSAEALMVDEGSLLLDVQSGREAYSRLKAGVVSGISIGYMTKRESFQGSVRQLHEIDLFEVSLVTFPMNPLARVDAVKGAFEVLDRCHPELRSLERVLTPELAVALDEAKAFAALAAEAKAGRTLSAANYSLVVDCVAALESALAAVKALKEAAEPKAEDEGKEQAALETAAAAFSAVIKEMRGSLAASA
jgi:uncharacterized protein